MSDSTQGSGAPRRRLPLVSGIGKLLSLCNNVISMIGIGLTAIALVLITTFALFTLISAENNPYLDIVGYLILPTIFVAGLIVVPIGIIWTRWRAHRLKAAPAELRIDFTDRKTWSAMVVFLAVTFFVVLPGLAVTSYQGYVYTESTDFCANVCHTVMEPQGVAHANSAHARVTCAACHIGEGAGWFVKSKLSGTRQVFAVMLDTFSRPIPPAITELRPARETCEHCHWPAKFHGKQLAERVHYSPNKQNTRHVVRMLLKTGGADESIGRVEGIHMHMMVAGRTEYVALDEHLQEIPWVRHTATDGTITVYRSDGKPADAAPPAGTHRVIDCMDCHNRGAHHFATPQSAVNLQLEAGRIDTDLPFIKREAVAALVQPYPDVPTAEARIEQALLDFYKQKHPDVWASSEQAIHAAVTVVQGIYRRTFFPEMKVNWQVYPENIGHLNSPGCIRCHDGLHVSEGGSAISSDCNVCHTFLNAVEGSPDVFKEGPFQHSMPLTLHEGLRCSQCHNGGKLLLCRDCHADLSGLTDWRDHPRLQRLENKQ
jgi:hypothetical protein